MQFYVRESLSSVRLSALEYVTLPWIGKYLEVVDNR